MNTKQTPTLPSMAAVKVEAQAERNGESVPLALCAVCGQPNAQWVVAQQQMIINEWSSECMIRGKKIRDLEADKAVLTTENERMNRELMRPDNGGDKDGCWGFIILLLAIVASFGLGCAVGGAV